MFTKGFTKHTIRGMNEDLDYTYSDPDDLSSEAVSDPDYNNKSVLVEVSNEIKELIGQYNSLDVLDVKNHTQPASIEVQIMANQQIVKFLRNFKNKVDSKIEEL